MSRLYELSIAYNSIYDLLSDDEANLDMLEDTLQCIEGEIEVKGESIGKLIKMLEYDADAIQDEVDRLKAIIAPLMLKKLARENRISRVKAYLLGQMEIMKKDKIKTPLMTIYTQTTKSVDDHTPALIPAKYQRIEYSLDRKAILEDLKQGIDVPGCAIKQSKGVRIR